MIPCVYRCYKCGVSRALVNYLQLYLSMFEDIFKQLPSWHIFHYHEDIGWCTDHLITACKIINNIIQLFLTKTSAGTVYMYNVTWTTAWESFVSTTDKLKLLNSIIMCNCLTENLQTDENTSLKPLIPTYLDLNSPNLC